MTVNFRGYLFNDAGIAVVGADVDLFDIGTTNPATGTTTDSSESDGLWKFDNVANGHYDVRITSNSSVRWIRGADQIQLKEIDVRNNTGNTTAAGTFTNYTNNVANQVAVFSGANSSRADGDVIYISYELANSAGEQTEFARMIVEAEDTHNGSEDGAIRFQVMRDGTLATVWEVKSTGDGDVDAPTMSFDLNMDSLSIGNGADTDIVLTFDANTSDGVITWMEDEDYFQFSDDILMSTTERINLRDDAIYIYSSADGQLDLVADTEIQIAATTIDINGAADISGDLTLSGGADGALQFTNAGENSIKIPDNQASALIIEEADNAYITFVTTNSSEAITVAKATTFSAGIANSGTIAAGTWQGTAIASGYIAADAITGAKIADDALDSEHYTDGSIDTAHLAADVITGAKIADDAIDSEHYTDGSIDTAHIADDAVTSAKIADDAITSALIADDAVVTAAIADNAITNALMADDAIDSAEIADAAVDFVHIQNVAANSILGRNANSSGVLSEVALATTQILIGDGTGFTAAALSGAATMTNAGVVSLATATTSAVGGVELATTAEINTSTDAVRAMTPDLYAASNYGLRYVALAVGTPSTAISTGDGKAYFHVPVGLNGMSLTEIHAELATAGVGSSTVPTIDLRKNASTPMLSAKITIDTTTTGSDQASAAPALHGTAGNYAVATNDVVSVDIDAVGDSTAGSGLVVTLGFRIP